MNINELKIDGYERVVEFTDNDFQAYIALHNTNLGPALGGCRIKSYTDSDAALLDVIRLSKGMTYKSSLAGLNLGGGKCVVNASRATRDIMLKVGEAVNYFKGDYITAEDIGTTLEDILITNEVTPYMVKHDGSSLTAKGVMVCMQAALDFSETLTHNIAEVPIWVQGLGKVGYDLVERLSATGDGTNLLVNDIRRDVVNRAVMALGAREVHELDKPFVTIYSPCALGQVVNPDNIDSISFPIICGSANNQLVNDDYANILAANNVLYCPDWLVNAGGVIAAACEVGQEYDHAKAETMTDYLGERLREVLWTAKTEGKTPLRVAIQMAENLLMD